MIDLRSCSFLLKDLFLFIAIVKALAPNKWYQSFGSRWLLWSKLLPVCMIVTPNKSNESRDHRPKFSGRIFVYTMIVTRVSPYQDPLAEHLPEALFSSSRGLLLPRISRPENFHILSTTQQFFLRTPPSQGRFFLFQARQLQQPTSLIFTFNSTSRIFLIHGVSNATGSSYVLNVAITPTPVRTFIGITPNNQGYNLGSYEEISKCKSCSFGDPHDPRLPKQLQPLSMWCYVRGSRL